MTDTWFVWGSCGDLGIESLMHDGRSKRIITMFPIEHIKLYTWTQLIPLNAMRNDGHLSIKKNPVVKWSAKVSDVIIN